MKPSDRRKFLAEVVPYVVRLYWDASRKLDPFALLSQALHDYGEEGEKLLADRSVLQSLFTDMKGMEITLRDNELSFLLDRVMALELIHTYLCKVTVGDGNYGASWKHGVGYSAARTFDGELKLASKSIYVTLLDKLTTDEISACLSKAQSVSPSDYWVFSVDGDEKDIALDPVFANENTVLIGHLHCRRLEQVLEELFECRFSVHIKRSGDKLSVSLSVRRSLDVEGS